MNNMKHLITERKQRLATFMAMQGFLRLTGQREELADVSEAVKDNEDTDKQLLDFNFNEIELLF